MIVGRTYRLAILAFAAGVFANHFVRRFTNLPKATSSQPTATVHTSLAQLSHSMDARDRNLAYWDSAQAAAQDIAAMVKQDIRHEYALDAQAELLSRLTKAVRVLQGVQHRWESGIRTTAAPTPRKKPTCVHNPPMHYERTGDFIRECKTYKRGTAAETMLWFPTQAVVLTMKSAEHPSIASRLRFLEKQGFRAEAFQATNGSARFAARYGTEEDPDTGRPVVVYTDPTQPTKRLRQGDRGFLTSGELGYRATMKRTIETALANGTESLMVMDDDVILDCAFRKNLEKVLSDHRCGATVRPTYAGPSRAGILLLGAAIWIQGTYPERGPYCSGWKVTDAEMVALRNATHKPPLCFSAHSKVFGSFAAIYHRSSFKAILTWLNETSLPFDHIYPALIRKDKLIRVAYPNLAIQDVGHVSQIDPSRTGQHNFSWRANIHRWEPVGRYCDPQTTLPLTHHRDN